MPVFAYKGVEAVLGWGFVTVGAYPVLSYSNNAISENMLYHYKHSRSFSFTMKKLTFWGYTAKTL